MPQAATIKSLPEAFAVIKEMQGQDCDWGEDYRAAGSTENRSTMAVVDSRWVTCAGNSDRHRSNEP